MKLKDYIKQGIGFEEVDAFIYEAFESVVSIYRESVDISKEDNNDIDEAINIIVKFNSGFEDNKEEIVKYLNKIAKEAGVKAFEASIDEGFESVSDKIKSVAIATYRAIIDAIKRAYVTIKTLGDKIVNMQPLLKRKAKSVREKISSAKEIDFSKLKNHCDSVDYITANIPLEFFMDVLNPISADENIDLSKFFKSSQSYNTPIKFGFSIETPYGKIKPIVTKGNMALLYADNGFKSATMDGYKELNKMACEKFAKIGSSSKEANLIYGFIEDYDKFVNKLQKFIDSQKSLEKLSYREDTYTAEQIKKLKDAKEAIETTRLIIKIAPTVLRELFKIINIITMEN